MRTILFLTLATITGLIMRICILHKKVQTLEYNNTLLNIMIDNVVNYSDSKADTGEFDEFVNSPQGEKFFKLYNKYYKTIKQ